MDQIKTAIIGFCASSDKSKNIERAVQLIEKASLNGAQWIHLPEVFSYVGDYQNLPKAAEAEDGPLNTQLSNLAKKLGVVLFAGSVAESIHTNPKASADKVFNTSYVFGRDGSILAKYRKIHLFNLDDEGGAGRYCESDGYLAGDELVRFKVDGWNCGLCICYDLRFSELFLRLSEVEPLDVLCAPAAFTKKTGAAHWHLLLRNRAIELQSYVIAANQCGRHDNGKESFGHGAIVDPWGEILADCGPEDGIVSATIEKSRIQQVRAMLPVLNNRREIK